jgi:hypothetical protein
MILLRRLYCTVLRVMSRLLLWKSGGKLGAVNVQGGRRLWAGEERDFLELVRRREVLQEKVEKIDIAEAKRGVIKGFYIDESRIVDVA